MTRADCKSFVRGEPHFHSKFCVKKVHHKKTLCSWHGGGSGGVSGTSGGSVHNHGHLTITNGPGMSVLTGPQFESPGSSVFLTGSPAFELPPMTGVPGPTVGTGVAGLFVALVLLLVLAWRRG